MAESKDLTRAGGYSWAPASTPTVLGGISERCSIDSYNTLDQRDSDCVVHQNSDDQFKRKAKYRDEEPTLVSKKDFELVRKALSLHQQQSLNDCESPDAVLSSDLISSASSLASDTTSVTSDFIAWIDTPLASAPATIPPVVTFAGEEKGQPVTVVFYHGQTVIQTDSNALVPIIESSSSSLLRYPSMPCCTDRPQVPTSKVTLKFSAGVCLIRKRCENSQIIPEVLVIRRNSERFFELPKGHLEKGESLIQAAARELVEETGMTTPIEIGEPLLSERYVVRRSPTERLEKSVHYFKARLHQSEDAVFGEREVETKELKWMGLEEAKSTFWKSNAVRSVVMMALTDCQM